MNENTTTRWTTLLGLILVPVLVAGGLLWANWNDNERLRQVEAAIVNLDEPVTLDGEYIPLGRQLTAALVDSDRVQNLAWVLESEQDARQGLATGRYAAMVTIPPDFSAAATSYAGKASEAASATIQVETSPVAGIADATLGKVVAQEAAGVLNQTLTSTYLDQIYLGFNELGEQFVTISDGAGELADGARDLADGISTAADGAGQLADGNGELAGGLRTLARETAPLPGQTRTLANGVADYVNGVNALVDQTIDTVDQQGELVSGIGQLSQGAAGVAAGIAAYRDAMGGLVDNTQLAAAARTAAQQQAGSQAVQTGLSQAAEQAAAAAQSAAQTAAAQAAPCPAEIEQAGGCAFFEAGRAAGVAVGVNVGAQAGAQAGLQVGLEVGVPVGIGAAGQAAAAGVTTKDPDTGQSLLSGAQLVAGGLDQLHDQLGEAAREASGSVGKLKQLKSGGNQLAEGTDQLADGIPQLVDGISQLADGADTLAQGTSEFADGLTEASDGADQLADGARQLADGLAEGKDQLPSYSESDRTTLSEVVATPVSTTNLLGTAGFGAGWVTLLMVLALWAGAMATFLVFRPVDRRVLGSADSSLRLVARTLAPSLGIVAVQAVLVTVIGQVALQLPAGKVLAVGALMLLAALAFVAVNHALAAWLGNAGRLIGLALAVLALASALTSAAPAVFGVLRGFSPLTPALDAVRAVVTESSAGPANTLLLLGWAVLGLAAGAIAIVRHRTTDFATLLRANGVA